MEALTRNGFVRLFSAYRRHQRVMAIIPEGQRNISLIAQPGVGAIGPDHQTSGQHVAVFQRQKSFVLAPHHLLEFGRRHQRHVGTAFGFLPKGLMDNRILDDMAEMAVAHAAIVKRDAAKTVFIPHFHTVIATGTLSDNGRPNVQL